MEEVYRDLQNETKFGKGAWKKKARVRFDVCKLRSGEFKRRYNIEVKNRFEALGDIGDPLEVDDKILVTHTDAAEKVIGRSKNQSKTWIGDKTWEKLKRRKRQN